MQHILIYGILKRQIIPAFLWKPVLDADPVTRRIVTLQSLFQLCPSLICERTATKWTKADCFTFPSCLVILNSPLINYVSSIDIDGIVAVLSGTAFRFIDRFHFSRFLSNPAG